MIDTTSLEQLIKNSPNLTVQEKSARIEQLQKSVCKMDKSAKSTKELLESVKKAIFSPEDLLEFCRSEEGIRRWYVSRVFGSAARPKELEEVSPEHFYVDLYHAPANKRLLQRIDRLSPEAFDLEKAEAFFLEQDRDKLGWWRDEDFEQTVHLRVASFRQVLDEFSSYPSSQPIEEGMVFVEISRRGQVRFVQFSYQARQKSKEVSSLLNKTKGGKT